MRTGGMGFYFDPTYLLVLIGFVLCLIAQAKVKSAFKKYSQIPSARGITGAQAAAIILQNAGLMNVRIQPVAGSLTDHYDPKSQTVNLSETVFGSRSIAAVSVAAHECGHAIQHAEGYGPLNFRSAMVPAANIGSKLAWPILIIGFILGGTVQYGPSSQIANILIWVGIGMYSLAVLFQLVTLPVELNASKRALVRLQDYQILMPEEHKSAKSMLTAAAMTYVAGAAAGVLQLLRIILLVSRRD